MEYRLLIFLLFKGRKMAYNRGNSSAEVDMGKLEESGIRPVVIKEIIEFAKSRIKTSDFIRFACKRRL